MIASFRDKETERVFHGYVSRSFPPTIQPTARRKLVQIDSVSDVLELANPPGNRLERLLGTRQGQWSIRINDQWRICFRWVDSASDVEIVDYH